MTARIASLGMYDLPALHAANDRLWAALAARLRDAGCAGVPDALDRGRPLAAIWDDPALLLAQTCGYPLTTRWRGRLRYVATPCYAAPGCEGPLHRSRLIVRAADVAATLADLRGRVAAINERASNSGLNLLRAATAPLARDGRFYASVIETGSHLESARAVAAGQADIAAIDTVSLAHIELHEPALAARLRTIGWTAATPAPPFVTAWGTPPRVVALLREGLCAVLAGSDAGDALLLDGITVVPLRRYETILTLERRAARRGYPILA